MTDTKNVCLCGLGRLPVIGPTNSDFLLVGDSVSDEDVKDGMIFSGKRGEILFGELARVGLQIRKARLTCIDMHTEPQETCKANFAETLREMRGRRGVLLMGAQTCSAFDIDHISKKYGLVIEDNPYFPQDVGFVMIAPAPPSTDLIGEFRLAIEKFAKKLEEK